MNNALKKAVKVTLLSPPDQEDYSATPDATLNIRQNGVQLLTGRRRCGSSAYWYLCGRNRNRCGQSCQNGCNRCSESQGPRHDDRQDIENVHRRSVLPNLCSLTVHIQQI
jgi:hypothetical protein